MMKRTQRLASHGLRGALFPFQESSVSAASIPHRTLQVALYSSNNFSRSSRSRWFSPSIIPCSVAGAVSFSVAASSVVPQVYAKKPTSLDRLPRDVVFIECEPCPYRSKVKAFLDYHDIPYKIVNPLSQNLIKRLEYCKHEKVPIVIMDGEQLVDSSDIINKLDKRIHPEKSVHSYEEKDWQSWVDSHLAHVSLINIFRSASEALESFDYSTSKGNFSFTTRLMVKYMGAALLYIMSKKSKKIYNITDERAALYEAAETWVDALNGRNFLGGSKPNLADLAVFGVLRPMRYLRSGKDMVANTRIGEWYTRMEIEVGDSSSIKEA